MRRYVDEVEARAHTREDMGPLFAFPTAPVDTELASSNGKIAERYRQWRATAEGSEVFALILAEARRRAARGEQRVSSKGLVEWLRASAHITVNNVFTADLGRELVTRDPSLRDLIEFRVRKGS
jgi:hypothetical protein